MFNGLKKIFSPRQLRIPLAGLLLAVVVVADRTKPVLSDELPTLAVPSATEELAQTSTLALKNQPYDRAIAPEGNFPKQNGIYLYGQTPTPNQIGQGYIVFEVKGGRIQGALYMPQSEFSCFQGTVEQSGVLAMTVQGYPGEMSSSQVATSGTGTLPNPDEPSDYSYNIALKDFHRINKIGASDKRILQMCKE